MHSNEQWFDGYLSDLNLIGCLLVASWNPVVPELLPRAKFVILVCFKAQIFFNGDFFHFKLQ